jgi:hypothetical protein
MSTFLAYVDFTLVGYAAVFVATLVFSQKIKDWFKGIPADMRTTLNNVEALAVGNARVARNSVLSQLETALPPLPVVKAPAPAAPAAPAAPVPPAAA